MIKNDEIDKKYLDLNEILIRLLKVILIYDPLAFGHFYQTGFKPNWTRKKTVGQNPEVNGLVYANGNY